MKRITLPGHIVNQVIEQVQQSPDQEICGLIGAHNGQPSQCYSISNIADDPRYHFLLDPKQQIDAMRTMRESGEILFAIYHSHPNGSPQPSPEDIEMAAYPDALYLIVTSPTNGNWQLNGFYIREGTVQPVDVTAV